MLRTHTPQTTRRPSIYAAYGHWSQKDFCLRRLLFVLLFLAALLVLLAFLSSAAILFSHPSSDSFPRSLRAVRRTPAAPCLPGTRCGRCSAVTRHRQRSAARSRSRLPRENSCATSEDEAASAFSELPHFSGRSPAVAVFVSVRAAGLPPEARLPPADPLSPLLLRSSVSNPARFPSSVARTREYRRQKRAESLARDVLGLCPAPAERR